MQYSNYGTGKTSPKGKARVTAEGGITTSRMFVREARERAQEEEMINKLNTIEQRMNQCSSQKQIKLRMQSHQLRAKNMENQNRLEQQRNEEQLANQKNREQLEQKKNKRMKAIQQEYEAQTNDFENYRYKKEVQKEKIEMQKALNKCQTEKLHGALMEKVEREKMILEGQRDEQIIQNLKK